MKKQICEAFCNEIEVRRVPAGFAVRTPFSSATDDTIGFFIIPDRMHSSYRLEDDGANVAVLEALGVNLEAGTRYDMFAALLNEYGLSYDKRTREIHSDFMTKADIPAAAIRFVALLLRLQDFGFVHPRVVETTFREDAKRTIDERFSQRALVRHDDVLSKRFQHYPVDAIIEVNGSAPVAVYYGTSDTRVNEAVLLWMETHLVRPGDDSVPMDCRVILLLERASPAVITERALGRAMNHLDAVLVFRGEETSAMDRLSGYVFPATAPLH